jgi:hypothetical protein
LVLVVGGGGGGTMQVGLYMVAGCGTGNLGSCCTMAGVVTAAAA